MVALAALAALASAALLPSTALYGSPPRRPPMRVCMRQEPPAAPTGFQIAGVDVAAAGVIPFMRRRDGVYYLMQSHENGTRAGLLSDFGGKREEDDVDAYYTAARELAEETGSVFGSAEALASRLRQAARCDDKAFATRQLVDTFATVAHLWHGEQLHEAIRRCEAVTMELYGPHAAAAGFNEVSRV